MKQGMMGGSGLSYRPYANRLHLAADR